jgi:uncharacterized delta-60 repeat protein
MYRLLITMAAAGAAAMLALAPATSANRNGAPKRALSTASARALAIQPNGKIVAGGQRRGTGYSPDPAESSDFALARYKSNGRLDPSFGVRGRVVTDFGLSYDYLQAVALQPDGKIVAAGATWPRNEGAPSFALARYDSHGRLDPRFGKHGKVRIRFGHFGSGAYALAVQPDGRIIAAGLNYRSEDTPGSWVVARFNPDGSRDRSFGDGGSVFTPVAPVTYIAGMTVDSNGKIILAGDECANDDPPTACALTLVRLNPDGSPDQSFGSSGKVSTQFPGFDDVGACGVAVQGNGQIVAAGTAGRDDNNYNFVLARYNADGSLDSGFGEGGTVMTDLEPEAETSDDYASGLALEPDGAIVVAGVNPTEDFVVAVYDTHGVLDPSFGGTGFVHTDVSSRKHDDSWARAVAIAPDGRIVTVGENGNRFALVRYMRDGGLDKAFGKGGTVHTAFGSPATVVVSFAAADKDRGTLIRWGTVVEVEARGFNLYREQHGHHRVRVNSGLMPGRGSDTRGASYSFLDTAAPPHGRLYYSLELVKRDGTRVSYGRVEAER